MRAPGADAGARYRHERALSAPTRVVDTSARYIPLAVSTTPSRCQRPPHGADNARPYRQRALELAPGPTTRVHALGNTLARAGHAADTADHARCPGGAPSPGPGILRTRSTTPTARGHARTRARPQEDCSGSRTTPTGYAHKDPDLRNTHRTQGRNQALACGPVLLNSLPCVRHQRTRTPKKDGPRRKGRLTAWGPPAPPGKSRPHHLGSPARTTWGAAPAASPYGSGFTARCRATMPPVRLRYWTSDQPLRAIMAPRARWSGHWRIDSTK